MSQVIGRYHDFSIDWVDGAQPAAFNGEVNPDSTLAITETGILVLTETSSGNRVYVAPHAWIAISHVPLQVATKIAFL